MVEWGQRGFLQCEKILDQAKGPVAPPDEGFPDDIDLLPVITGATSRLVCRGDETDREGDDKEDSPLSDLPDPAEPDHKKLKQESTGMTLEEYEAMLDAEAENGEGGFLEAGDIPESSRQEV